MLALEKLSKESGYFSYNVGTGNGYSNKEVVSMVKKVSGASFDVEVHPRRPGDANELIADCSKIQQDLGFKPEHSDLETIVKSAWQWHLKQSQKI
jgi:UDP-glucose 4-epimerase